MTEPRANGADYAEQFRSEYEELLRRSARSSDPRLAMRVIALGDDEVRDRFLTLLEEGYRFRRFDESASGVRVEFDPPAGQLQFGIPTLHVDLNLAESRVLGVHVDLYGDATSRDAVMAARTRDGTTKEVEVRIVGPLRWAKVKVEGVDFNMRTSPSGGISDRRTVLLIPDHVDIQLELNSGPWVTATVSAKINGKEQKQDISLRGGLFSTTVQFKLSDFGL